MLNTLVKKYNEDKEAYKNAEDNKMMEFVNGRITNVIADLKKVESDIEEYKMKNDITFLESDALFYSELFKNLQSSIVEAEIQVRQIQMLDDYINDPANKYKVIPPLFSAANGEEGVVSTYNNAIMERERYLKPSDEDNPFYQKADDMVKQLRVGVVTMIENASKNTKITLDNFRAKEKQMLSKMRTIPEKEREYINFRRNQEIFQGLYIMLLQKQEETALSLSKKTETARIIEPAYVKKKPLGPRKLYALLGILIFTLVVPVGYLFSKDLVVSLKEEFKKS